MVAWAAEKVSLPKLASGSTLPKEADGASMIHSAEERWALGRLCTVVNVGWVLVTSVSDSVKPPDP
jgi:hypothetical protein